MLSKFKQSFLYMCNQRNVSHDDLGYILADCFKYEDDQEFINSTKERCNDFFDHPNKITQCLNDAQSVHSV